MYKFGIIGLGRISQYYLAAISKNPNIKLAAFCDKNNKIEILKNFNVPFYTDFKIMLAKQKLDAVIVLTPNYTHCGIVTYAIAKKIHVLCEKPLGINLREHESVVNRAKAEDIIVWTAFHRRFNRNIKHLIKIIGSTKDLQTIRVRYLENINEHSGGEKWYFDSKKSGGGCVIDNGINVFDLILDFVPDPIVESAELAYGKSGTDVKAKIKLFDNISEASIIVDLDWNSAKEIKDIVITTRTTRIKADMLVSFPLFKESLWHEYEGVIGEFVNLLKNKKSAYIDSRSLKAMQLVDEIYKFKKTNKPI